MKRTMKNRVGEAPASASAGACLAAFSSLTDWPVGRSAGRCRRQCPAGNRLFYYSKNAHRAGAFKLLGGNYFVSPRRRRRRRHGTAARPPGQYGSGAAACIRMCRAGPGRASHGADAGPVEALNLDDATEHMAAHRHGPRPPGPRNDRVYYHRLETMAWGRHQAAIGSSS